MRPPPVDWQGSTFTGKDNKKRAPISNPVKTAEGKRTRRDRRELEEIVFNLFERRPNWALKQLVEETDQPVAFLKEVLNDLCIYNKRGANQGTYELKPEYRRKPKEEDVKAAT
jgi:transcription initiation factor TFIIF subunit beta